MQKRRLNVARVPKGVRLGPTNRLKIAAEGVTSRFLLSFPPFLSWPSSFSRPLFLSRSQFIEALGTCHLSAAHRGRAHSASTTAPATGIADGSLRVRRGRNSGEGAERRILWNISPHIARSFKTTRVWSDGMSSRETGERSSVFHQPCYFEEVSPRI